MKDNGRETLIRKYCMRREVIFIKEEKHKDNKITDNKKDKQ